MWLANVDTIRKAVSAVRGMRPALTLIGGDFVYNPTEDEGKDVERDELEDVDENIRQISTLLGPLSSIGTPVFAVLGNHDYGMMERDSVRNDLMATRVKSALERIGVTVLDNRSMDVHGLYVVG